MNADVERCCPERDRLARLLRPSDELLCVAPAVLRNAPTVPSLSIDRVPEGQSVAGFKVEGEENAKDCFGSWRQRSVWFGLGRIRNRPEEHMIFIFSRMPRIFARNLLGAFESIYAIIPVVQNVRVDVDICRRRCILMWTAMEITCAIEDIEDGPWGSTVLQVLEHSWVKACQAGYVFHQDNQKNHQEIWRAYREYIPFHLAWVSLADINSQLKAPLGHARTRTRTVTDGGNHLTLLCITWNVGATPPMENATLRGILEKELSADLICLGFQETCALSTKNVMITDGDESLTERWLQWAQEHVTAAYDGEMELRKECHLVGMLILIFVRRYLGRQVIGMRTDTVSTGVGMEVGDRKWRSGNKGAVSIRFEIRPTPDATPTSFCFVNAHLAAGQEHYIERCQHYRAIMSGTLFREGSAMQEHDRSAQDEKEKRAHDYTILDHHHIFWIGDTNSRLHCPERLGGMKYTDAHRIIQEGKASELFVFDQLRLMRRDGLAFDGFSEHPIHFEPSYKWIPNGYTMDIRSQKHLPAWTDRILFKSKVRPAAKAYRYDMYPHLRQSDHRPVFACFTVPLATNVDGLHEPLMQGGGSASSSAPVAAASSPMTSAGLREDPGPGLALPPKELMAVMQWVLQQSRDAAPGSLEWWPDPLLDCARRGKEEISEMHRYLYVKRGWPLPRDNPQLPPRSAALFLLDWLDHRPEPIVPLPCAEQMGQRTQGAAASEVLRALPPSSRSVLICIAALFAQLAGRHGQAGDVVARLARGLTQVQQARSPAPVEQLVGDLMEEFGPESAFPPWEVLRSAG